MLTLTVLLGVKVSIQFIQLNHSLSNRLHWRDYDYTKVLATKNKHLVSERQHKVRKL